MNAFSTWPKAELHVHLDGSVRPGTVWALAQAEGVSLPFKDRGALERRLRVPRHCTLPQYLEAFRYTVAVLQSAAALTRVAREFVADVAEDGVRYVEVRFAPSLHRERGLSLAAAIEAVLEGLRAGERETGTTARLICCAMRQESSALSEIVAQTAAEFRPAGVVAFDLAGPEEGHPPEVHRGAIEQALAAGLHLTLHAGEPGCPEHVRRSVELGAERIGHGTYLVQDEALMDWFAGRGVPLEVCPTSNVQIADFFDDYASHPLRTYARAGIPITLNTDNRLMSNVTLSDEYAHIAPHLPEGALREIARAGFEHAFLPEAERDALIAQHFPPA